MTSRQSSTLLFFVGFTAVLILMHLPYVKLPYYWDELGQYVPAALDLYGEGSWVPHSTVPNVHPPAVMALLALVWKLFGVSILSARVTMLVVASAGVLFCFLLSIRLSRGQAGAPAFAAALFLIASPLFYTQSMMVLLDMPAMTLTLAALLLFLDRRWILCAAVCTVLALTKETAITTPVVFAAWLWLRDRKRREALYFFAPLLALIAWLVMLHHATGHWLGNEEFARYNATGTLSPPHIAEALIRRAWFLFVSDGNFLGALALYLGWRVLKGAEWAVTLLVAGAQLLVVTLFGGAMLERYLLPVLPIVYIAMAAAATVYPATWRRVSHAVMIGLLMLGWFWNPPYPFPFENNLAMVDFVKLQEEAASYLEAYAADKRIASQWPFTDAIRRPEFGYVEHALRPVPFAGFSLTSLASTDRASYDVAVVYTRTWPVGGLLDVAPVTEFLRRYVEYEVPATDEQMQAGLGLSRVRGWERGGQSISIYVKE